MTRPEDPTQPADAPSAVPMSDEQLVQLFGRITLAFCGGLVMIGAVVVLFIVEQPTVGATGLALGVVLGLASWFAPGLVIRSRLAGSAGKVEGPDAVRAAVSAAVFLGIACTEAPALLGVVLAVSGHDVGAVVIAVPVAIASLIANVSGPSAVRGHLARLRSPMTF